MNSGYVLGRFDLKIQSTRRLYRNFVEKGIAMGKRDDLTGGGLIRSAGGWAAVKTLRKANTLQKGDERILANGDFVTAVPYQAREAHERKYQLKAEGFDMNYIAHGAARIAGISPEQIWTPGKHPEFVKARSLICYWATNELGVSQIGLRQHLGLSQSAISFSVKRGRTIVKKTADGEDGISFERQKL